MRSFLLLFLLLLPYRLVFSQAEDVPVSHPVYLFLKRMEVKGLIERYHDAVLPLSRREVARFLVETDAHREQLTSSEKGWLDDYLSEFRYDIKGSTEGLHSLIDSGDPSFGQSLGAEFSNREKYLYLYADSNVSFFLNGLLDLDYRHISGDALGDQHAEFVQGGGIMRGTILGHLGYFLQGTNAEFRGSRELLQRDPILSQSHALFVTNTQNFDFTEGYMRYDANIVSAQIGRERVLWGNGYDDYEKMVLSDVPREFDFLRADFQYKALKYTFLHAWLMGPVTELQFTLPSDTTAVFTEPVAADKYFAAHRIELSFPRLFDLGFQEMYIYSNRAPDLAYLNPFAVYESVQRSRGERDNGFWVFDIQTHFFPDLEFSGTMLYDDIHIPYLFSNHWEDRYAWQVGMMYADAFSIPNTNLMVQYTRVEPYVFSHNRSRDDNYTSDGLILGPQIGPDADAWFFRGDYLPARNLILSLRVSFERKGENVVDASGHLIRNVGGDVLQPHRDTDPEFKTFLDGTLVRTRRLQFLGTWEIVNQMWLDGSYLFDSQENTVSGQRNENNTLEVRLRLQL